MKLKAPPSPSSSSSAFAVSPIASFSSEGSAGLVSSCGGSWVASAGSVSAGCMETGSLDSDWFTTASFFSSSTSSLGSVISAVSNSCSGFSFPSSGRPSSAVSATASAASGCFSSDSWGIAAISSSSSAISFSRVSIRALISMRLVLSASLSSSSCAAPSKFSSSTYCSIKASRFSNSFSYSTTRALTVSRTACFSSISLRGSRVEGAAVSLASGFSSGTT
mmetsp:Transcript_16899/g.26843  ORF Transcript_16899/g.26843 Transcript_16899/m.26843 type:complete len:221 (+) Transcript_16899:131-793(+)